jgi:hypothetical protein
LIMEMAHLLKDLVVLLGFGGVQLSSWQFGQRVELFAVKRLQCYMVENEKMYKSGRLGVYMLKKMFQCIS